MPQDDQTISEFTRSCTATNIAAWNSLPHNQPVNRSINILLISLVFLSWYSLLFLLPHNKTQSDARLDWRTNSWTIAPPKHSDALIVSHGREFMGQVDNWQPCAVNRTHPHSNNWWSYQSCYGTEHEAWTLNKNNFNDILSKVSCNCVSTIGLGNVTLKIFYTELFYFIINYFSRHFPLSILNILYL